MMRDEMQAVVLKLGLVLLLYTIYLSIIVCPELLKKDHVNDSSNYTPKSKRNEIWAMVKPMTTWIRKKEME